MWIFHGYVICVGWLILNNLSKNRHFNGFPVPCSDAFYAIFTLGSLKVAWVSCAGSMATGNASYRSSMGNCQARHAVFRILSSPIGIQGSLTAAFVY